MTKPPHQPARVVESIKSQVRKYLKRERRKDLPKDADFWDFVCRVGQNQELAKAAHVEEVIPAIDAASSEGWSEIYIEVLSKARKRNKRKTAKPSGRPSER